MDAVRSEDQLKDDKCRRLVQSRFEVIHDLLANEVGIGEISGFYEGFVHVQKDTTEK